jgi:uncharacterized protein with beta-barrel porin domain
VIAGLDLVHDGSGRFGLAGSYTVSDLTTKNGAAADVQGGRMLVYGSRAMGAWSFDHEVSLGFDGYHTRRLIALGGATRTAIGKADGYDVSLDLAAHYDLGFAVPFGEFRFDRVHRDAFTETGAGLLSLDVASNDLDAPRLLAGVDVDLLRTFDDTSPGCLLNLRLAWAHDFDGTFGATDTAFIGAPAATFVAFSSRPGDDGGLLALRAATNIDDRFELYGAYDLEARDRQIAQSISFGLRAAW